MSRSVLQTWPHVVIRPSQARPASRRANPARGSLVFARGSGRSQRAQAVFRANRAAGSTSRSNAENRRWPPKILPALKARPFLVGDLVPRPNTRAPSLRLAGARPSGRSRALARRRVGRSDNRIGMAAGCPTLCHYRSDKATQIQDKSGGKIHKTARLYAELLRWKAMVAPVKGMRPR
jgi:hypothetical protein